MVWHDLKKKHKDQSFSVEELEEMCNKYHVRFKAYMLMANNNQKIFGDVLKNLQFTHQCDDNKYPKTVAQMKNLLTGPLSASYPTRRYNNQFHNSNNNNRDTIGQSSHKEGSNNENNSRNNSCQGNGSTNMSKNNNGSPMPL